MDRKTNLSVQLIIAQIRSAFSLLDTSKDGLVDAQELKCMLQRFSIDIPDAIIEQLVLEVSKNGNRYITEQEFFRWMLLMDAHLDDIEGELRAAFQVFDIDRSGTITLDELKSAIELLGENVSNEELQEWLKLADVDCDGQIDYDEFIKIIMH